MKDEVTDVLYVCSAIGQCLLVYHKLSMPRSLVCQLIPILVTLSLEIVYDEFSLKSLRSKKYTSYP